jgi:hypothetical protein
MPPAGRELPRDTRVQHPVDRDAAPHVAQASANVDFEPPPRLYLGSAAALGAEWNAASLIASDLRIAATAG